jgi:hypothetical protein
VNPISRVVLASLVVALAAAAPARAQQRGAGAIYDRATFPYGERVNQPLTLPASLIRIDVPVVVNLTKDQVGEPWFVPVAADIGITNDLQVGVFHEVGLCLAGNDNGCGEVYDDFGGRLAFTLSRTPEAHLAAEANVLAFGFDDPGYRAGLALAYKRSLGNLGLTVRGGVDALVNRRDQALAKEVAFADGQLAVQLGDSLAVFGGLGVRFALEEAPGIDLPIQVPFTAGAEFEPIRKLTVGGELRFPNLLGEDATTDERELVVFLRLYI